MRRPTGESGVQICGADGKFGACLSTPGGTGGTRAPASSGGAAGIGGATTPRATGAGGGLAGTGGAGVASTGGGSTSGGKGGFGGNTGRAGAPTTGTASGGAGGTGGTLVPSGACGNGTLDPGEQCDCGTDASRLPTGCRARNGIFLGDGTGCGMTCVRESRCLDDAGQTQACTPACGDGMGGFQGPEAGSTVNTVSTAGEYRGLLVEDTSSRRA